VLLAGHEGCAAVQKVHLQAQCSCMYLYKSTDQHMSSADHDSASSLYLFVFPCLHIAYNCPKPVSMLTFPSFHPLSQAQYISNIGVRCCSSC